MKIFSKLSVLAFVHAASVLLLAVCCSTAVLANEVTSLSDESESEWYTLSNSEIVDTSSCKVNDIVTFGRWPQTIKASDVTITEETKTVGMFTYYKGSDGEWYGKVKEKAYNYNYYYSNHGTIGTSGTIESYFRVEPIRWRILTDNYKGKKLLLAESILVNKKYGVFNNYASSEIRSWLNGDFLSTAFSAEEQAAIALTSVDNSARSIRPGENETQWNKNIIAYDNCDNTEDKIFLLSMQEVTTALYGFATEPNASGLESARIRVTTDFAKANGAFQSRTAGYGGCWWIRSLLLNDECWYRALYVNGAGSVELGECLVYERGVVPALCLE